MEDIIDRPLNSNEIEQLTRMHVRFFFKDDKTYISKSYWDNCGDRHRRVIEAVLGQLRREDQGNE